MKILLCLLAVCLLAGCATTQAVQERMDVGLGKGKTITYYRDQWVLRSPPEVHVQAASAPGEELSVLFIPFRVTQQMPDPSIVGYTEARIVWQTWLTMRLFPNIEFSPDEVPYRRDRALQLARERGAQLVVGGFVTYLYAGGTSGDSQVAIQLEIHDTRSGRLIWSMAQSGMMPASRYNDYVLFATRTRLPSDPIHAITRALAADMGTVIQNWQSSPPPLTRMRQLDKDVEQTLFPPADPVPVPRNDATRAREDNERAF